MILCHFKHTCYIIYLAAKGTSTVTRDQLEYMSEEKEDDL